MRIRQSSPYLTDLFREAERGTLVPASFQRLYVWDRPEVEKFWTSLMRGYPVGSFLIWTPPRDVDVSTMGRARLGPILANPGEDSALILDGQNRLATYAWSVLNAETGIDAGWIEAFEGAMDGAAPLSDMERRTWLTSDFIAADPIERSVRFRSREEAASGRLLVPVATISDGTRLMPFLRRWEKVHGEIPADHLDWIGNEVDRRIREARVTVTNLEYLPREEALEAFRHIARAGVPMSDADFEQALSFAFAEPAYAP